ncbi:MAG: CofH family radical SAM protein [Gemmatimonadota bacterium]|jgi:aminodeoxyfutalosine synthase|nr:aminofutalosine synthase MqnE [Gemmatimonadota bacterium]MDP6460719.1 CofH family radical SAM protein [Gemmatimonadota bacterium]MDP6529693.1 CofH family radical SAM protein [Gemmatimonadota bacterium]MDP6802480.1 CofH family radical SAM protein [Gemmatimonadota bacterium]MDP7030963.1 CofH family radical SAM protein [Gemmatimonadota bacterium]
MVSDIQADRFQDPALARVAEKVACGERLDEADGLACLTTADLFGLGRIADAAKRAKTGERVYYVLNRQLNPTNLCILTCRFCDFAARPGDDHAYELSMEEILAHGGDDIDEIHIVGGLHPKWKFDRYVEITRGIHERWPRLPIKAWTAVEIDWFAKISKKPVEDILRELKAAGLSTMPGGGAEVFSERIRAELYPRKMGHERWFEIHRVAHSMGIRSNATLLYGHIETLPERVSHMLQLRSLQDETHGFHSFIPLEYQVGNSKLVERGASAPDGLRTIATARLLLDNIDHVKAYWVMLGEETASAALNFGADDMDGTIDEERVAHSALADSPVGLTELRIRQLIREAGKIPTRRNAHYDVLETKDQTDAGAHSVSQL